MTDFDPATANEVVAIDDVDDDEEPVSVSDIGSAVVTDTDWTTETILSQMRRGNIHLNPRFQRRDAWDNARKSRFIESLILGLPIPQLVLAEDKRRKGTFIVLDGKQRLLTLSQFAKGSSHDRDPSEVTRLLRLSGLEVRADLARSTLRTLETDPARAEDHDSFLNQTIRTVVVRNWPDEDFLNLVFLRLNTGSVKLSPQELRQALHPGPFTDFIDDFASESVPLQRALNLSGPDFRMRDVELLLRYFGLRTSLQRYRGSLKRFLDETSDTLNGSWERDRPVLEALALEFNQAILAVIEVFGVNAFTRWNPLRQRYEGRFNRAVFDIMVYYLCDPGVREDALERGADIRELFQASSNANPAFVESLQTTTKTIDALYTRLSVWGEGLQSLGVEVSPPSLSPERILVPST